MLWAVWAVWAIRRVWVVYWDGQDSLGGLRGLGGLSGLGGAGRCGWVRATGADGCRRVRRVAGRCGNSAVRPAGGCRKNIRCSGGSIWNLAIRNLAVEDYFCDGQVTSTPSIFVPFTACRALPLHSTAKLHRINVAIHSTAQDDKALQN